MENLIKMADFSNGIKTVLLDNGDQYELQKMSANRLVICSQNIYLKDKIETVTIDYKDYFMTGFQFRKKLKNIQYRWFNVNTKNRTLTNSNWGNI